MVVLNWLGSHLVGILTFLTALSGFLLTFRRVKAIHVLVNSNLDKVMIHLSIEQDRTKQLTNSMKEAGIEVPDSPVQPENS